jgi:hypothetical protein
VGKSILGVFGMLEPVSLSLSGRKDAGLVHVSLYQWRSRRRVCIFLTHDHWLAGQALGAGIIAPIVFPTLLAMSKTLEPASARPFSPPFAYAVTLVAMQFTVFLLARDSPPYPRLTSTGRISITSFRDSH